MTQRKKVILRDHHGYGWEDLYFACYEAIGEIPKEGRDMRSTLWALSALLYTYLRGYEQCGMRGYLTLDQIRVISDWSEVDPEKIQPEMEQVLDAISRISNHHDRMVAALNHIRALADQCAPPVDFEYPDIHKRADREILAKVKKFRLAAGLSG